jgi:predicted transcriptional regulator
MKTVRFFVEVLQKGEVSFKTQNAYDNRLSWILNTSKLKDMGLIEEVKKKHSNEKFFRLTEKGKRLANIFYLLEKEMKEVGAIES